MIQVPAICLSRQINKLTHAQFPETKIKTTVLTVHDHRAHLSTPISYNKLCVISIFNYIFQTNKEHYIISIYQCHLFTKGIALTLTKVDRKQICFIVALHVHLPLYECVIAPSQKKS